MHWWHRLPLNVVYAALTVGYMLAASVFTLFLQRWLQPWAAVLVAVALPLPLLLYHVRRGFAAARSLVRAHAGSWYGYRAGDLSGDRREERRLGKGGVRR